MPKTTLEEVQQQFLEESKNVVMDKFQMQLLVKFLDVSQKNFLEEQWKKDPFEESQEELLVESQIFF